ncbi:MAG TPA: hypothetical protein VGS21_05285 [Acidimicrobiales bacterium]|nr:hypothetical protein [Acidimicrobiales bacterium]
MTDNRIREEGCVDQQAIDETRKQWLDSIPESTWIDASNGFGDPELANQ